MSGWRGGAAMKAFGTLSTRSRKSPFGPVSLVSVAKQAPSVQFGISRKAGALRKVLERCQARRAPAASEGASSNDRRQSMSRSAYTSIEIEIEESYGVKA